MKALSLFSGGGLGDYGLELAGMEIDLASISCYTIAKGV